MYKEYHPNPIIVARAVELWKEMISGIVEFNNGDNSPNDFMAQGLHYMLASKTQKTPEQIEKFGIELTKLLMNQQTSHGFTNYERSLDVDYHPNEILRNAAVNAGIDVNIASFPCKTNMWINDDCLSLRQGYGAQNKYHYPLSDGRWFVTDLTPSDDTDKIIKLVENGVLDLELNVIA